MLNCGVDELTAWFQRFALSDQQAGTSVTYVLRRDQRVIGFCTLAPHVIEAEHASGRLKAGQPSQRMVPVLLLARLGLDQSEHGSGLGGDLLRDALVRCAVAADVIGGRAVVVHAKGRRAAEFYGRYGFQPLPENPHHLYLLMKDLRKSIASSSG